MGSHAIGGKWGHNPLPWPQDDDRLARALANIINVVDPHVIVLSGGVSNMDRLVENVPGLWGPYVFSGRVNTILKPAVCAGPPGCGRPWSRVM